MIDPPWHGAAPEAFARLDPPLAVLVGGLQGGHGALDWVARDARGGLVVVLAAEPTRFLDLLGRALAERIWLEPRVNDWARLAPERGLDPALGAAVWIAGVSPEPGVEPAARAAGVGVLRMLRLADRWHAEPLVVAGRGEAPVPPGDRGDRDDRDDAGSGERRDPSRPRSVFRSGRPDR